MPRAFNENERKEIKQKLQETAEYFLLHHSMNKISVDDLINEAKIAKGTFYTFYDSKELLFYDVFLKLHDSIQNEFISQVKNIGPIIDAKQLTDVIFDLFKTLDETFIFKMAVRGDLERLMRMLPKSLHDEHIIQDQLSMKQLFDILPNIKTLEIEVFSSALRLALISIMYKQEIGEERFDEALYVVLYGIVKQMMGEK